MNKKDFQKIAGEAAEMLKELRIEETVFTDERVEFWLKPLTVPVARGVLTRIRSAVERSTKRIENANYLFPHPNQKGAGTVIEKIIAQAKGISRSETRAPAQQRSPANAVPSDDEYEYSEASLRELAKFSAQGLFNRGNTRSDYYFCLFALSPQELAESAPLSPCYTWRRQAHSTEEYWRTWKEREIEEMREEGCAKIIAAAERLSALRRQRLGEEKETEMPKVNM